MALDECLLLVEDDEALRSVIAYSLEREGFHVALAGDGQTALALIGRLCPDVLVLDLMIPEIDGFDVLRGLGADLSASVLVLTARADVQERLRAFELGACDYLTKPFGMRELIARVRALARRRRLAEGAAEAKNLVTGNGIRMEVPERRAWRHGSRLPLKPKEFDLLAFLMGTPGRVHTREDILEHVWGSHLPGYRTVDVHVRRLRAKIEVNPGKPRSIESVRGVGYRFVHDQTRMARLE